MQNPIRIFYLWHICMRYIFQLSMYDMDIWIYCRSIYAYSKKTFYFLYSSVIILGIFFIVMQWIFQNVQQSTDDHGDDHDNDHGNGRDRSRSTVCVPDYNRQILTLLIFFDVSFSILVLFLFINPLNKLMNRIINTEKQPDGNVIHSRDTITTTKSSSSRSNRNRNRSDLSHNIDFKYFAMKYTVISFVTVASTGIALVSLLFRSGYVISNGSLTAIDIVINSVCLVIMTTPWRRVFIRYASPFLLLWVKTHMKCQEKIHQYSCCRLCCPSSSLSSGADGDGGVQVSVGYESDKQLIEYIISLQAKEKRRKR